MSDELKDNLIKILRIEYTLYTEILTLSEEKTQALGSNDTDGLKCIISEISLRIERISEMEDKRKDILSLISKREHIPFSELTLSSLSSLWNEPCLIPLMRQLREVMTNLKQVNEKNTLLVNQASKVYSELQELLYFSSGNLSGYNEQGEVNILKGSCFEREV